MQRPVTLNSLRQKLVCFWVFGVRILKAQKFWLIYCQTISSDAMLGK